MSLESQPISIQLTREESLVLFEFLSRYSAADHLEIIDQAEQVALWKLCACFEKTLAEPFDPRYPELLAQARQALRQNQSP